ncbi:MAG TPA: DUF3008 family protein [Candidatus Paceibacterota bacterium]|nr:DUF3008 family protein [Candidatus Paceibacterota bacterium]
MPSKSKSQQRFMGMVHALQKGEMKPSEASPEVKQAAKSIKKKDATDFAETKHKGLPEKVKKKKKVVSESLDEFINEGMVYEDSPIMDLPQFEDAVMDKMQELGLTWEEADFAMGQIDPEQMDEWRMEVIDGISTLDQIAEETLKNSFNQ